MDIKETIDTIKYMLAYRELTVQEKRALTRALSILQSVEDFLFEPVRM